MNSFNVRVASFFTMAVFLFQPLGQAELINFPPETNIPVTDEIEIPDDTAGAPQEIPQLEDDSPLSAATVAPPPGAIVDPNDPTGSYAIRAANNFDVTGKLPGTFEFVEAQIRSKYLNGFDDKHVTTYHVFNNKGTLKRIEEYLFEDIDKTILSKIITRFYDLDREVHVEEFVHIPPAFEYTVFSYTPPPPLPISKRFLISPEFSLLSAGFTFNPAPQPVLKQVSPGRSLLKQWTIWNPLGEPLLSINQVQSDRSFDLTTGINNKWISTEFNLDGTKKRDFIKNPDGGIRQVIYYNPDGTVLREEFFNPTIDPNKILGPITPASRLREPLPKATSNEAYVRKTYLELLGRVATKEEIALWAGLLDSKQRNRTQVFRAIVASAEYRKSIIETYFQTYLGRPPRTPELNVWVKSGYTLGQIAQLIAKSNEGYIVGLYRACFGRDPVPAERARWLNALNAGYNRYLFEQVVVASPEATNRNYVLGVFQAFLGRKPDAANLAYWTNYLNRTNDRYTFWLIIFGTREAKIYLSR